MARAKRTDRAEARRRHRAQLASEAIDSAAESEDVEPESRPPAGRRGEPPPGGRPVSSRAQPPERLSLMAALRAAYEPAHIREDLAALPDLVRSRAIIVPAILVVVSVVVLIAASTTGSGDLTGAALSPSPSVAASAAASGVGATPSSPAPSSPTASSGPSVSPAGPSPSGTATGGGAGGNALLVTAASILSLLFLQVPPIGGIYAAAVLAKRASYIAGGIAGLMGALGLTAVLFSVPVNDAIGAVRASYAVQAIGTSLIFGVLLGGLLGYYRRLLRLMNPNRGRPAPSGRKAPARRRR